MNRSPRRHAEQREQREQRESPRRGGAGGDRSPSRMYQPSSGVNPGGGPDRSPPRRHSPRRNYAEGRGGSPRRGSYGGDRSPRRQGYGGGRGGERRERSFWSNEPRDMERSWRSGEQPPPPPRGGGAYPERREGRSERGKSRSPRAYEGSSFSRDYGSGGLGGRGTYRGRGGRGRRDGSRPEGDPSFARSNGPAGMNGGPQGGYGPEAADGKYDGPMKPDYSDTTRFNTSQALKMFAERWQLVLNDLRNDELPASVKPQVFKAETGKNVWGVSKLPLQAPVSDFLGELQKVLAASKEKLKDSPASPSD